MYQCIRVANELFMKGNTYSWSILSVLTVQDEVIVLINRDTTTCNFTVKFPIHPRPDSNGHFPVIVKCN